MEFQPTNIPYPNLPVPLAAYEREFIALAICAIVLLGWWVYRAWRSLEENWTPASPVTIPSQPAPTSSRQTWKARFSKLNPADVQFLEKFEKNVRSYLGEIHQVPLKKSLTTAELRKYAPREWMPLLTKIHNLRYQDESRNSEEQNQRLLELALSLIP